MMIHTERIFPQYAAAGIAAIGSLIVGFSLGWSSPAGPRLTTEKEFGFSVTEDENYWIASILTLGAGISCIPMGFLINSFGRKVSIICICFPCICGWALLYCANSVMLLYVGRFILGITAAAFATALPMYIAEISTKNIRGILSSFFQLSISTGIFLIYLLGWPLPLFVITLAAGLVPILFLGCFSFMPESPMYLLNKGDKEGAIESLKWLRGQNCDYQKEINELSSDQYVNKSGFMGILKALKRRESLKAMFYGCTLMLFQQMCGINVVIFYTNEVFETAKIAWPADAATSLVGVTQIFANLIALAIIDKLGRKIVLAISSSILGIVTAILGAYFYLQDTNPDILDDYRWLPILLLCLFNFVFALGLGPIPWIMMGELFPPDIKGIGGSVAGATNWLLAFLVTSTYGSLKNSIGSGGTFWMYACISFIGAFYSLFALPETKGKSLIEIQDFLRGKHVDNIQSNRDPRSVQSSHL